MGRPKGSKNKATLAKELGMSLEEYNKLHSTDSEYDRVHSTSTDKEDKVESTNKGAEHPLITSKEHPVITSETKFLLPTTEEKPELKNKVKDKKYRHECACCHKGLVEGSEYRIDLCHFLGLEEYWFTIEDSHKLILCRDCTIKLAKYIDLYLVQRGLKTKFNTTKEEVEDIRSPFDY